MTSAPTELLIAPRVSVELMIESCLKGFGTAFEGVGARRHEPRAYWRASALRTLTRRSDWRLRVDGGPWMVSNGWLQTVYALASV